MAGLQGMNRDGGKALDGYTHLIQSIRDIFTTPIGTRVMRRDYGLDHSLVDRPINPALLIDLYAAMIDALTRWEPRFLVRQIRVSDAAAGQLSVDLDGYYRPTGDFITLEGILV